MTYTIGIVNYLCLSMITIVELTSFKRAVKKLLSEESIDNLKLFLSENPTAGDMIKGTGGLRKIRWSLDNNRGKSGGSRVIYYYCAENVPLYLFDCYAKNDKEDISEQDKKELSNLLKMIKRGIHNDWNFR